MKYKLLNIFYKLSKILQQRYPIVSDDLCEDAYYHISFYLKYGWILPWLWPIQILYRELIEDKHLKRILNKTETPEELLDLKADIITRFIGLSVPLAIESVILALGLLFIC